MQSTQDDLPEEQETKQLKLIIQPKVIDHLGIKMYQKPVDVVSEFIANAWDADSQIVEIAIQEDYIKIVDRGIGMSFDECQSFFLTVGRNRREDLKKETSDEKGRPLLGRKGIGKFAGFGIAQIVEVTTISKAKGELTSFEMIINEILRYDASQQSNKPINVVNYQPPTDERKASHGTTVILKGVNVSSIDIEVFKEELSRRFLLSQLSNDFLISVNNEDLPESFSQNLEFVFPRDFDDSEKLKVPEITNFNSDGWAEENFSGNQIKWRIGFFEEPIETDELRGIALFAKGKMAQKPFFFDISGGISGQHGLEYMTGQIIMDFIDTGSNDLIATERQRINLQSDLGRRIKEWGINKIKFLSSIWKERRSEKKLQELENRLTGFSERLQRLPPSERKTVKSVLLKIASFPRLGNARFHEWCNDILSSWERGRLRDLIAKIAETENVNEQQFIDILGEADVLIALNIAESIKTKILAIGGLKQRIDSRELENALRDYIYERPWIIHPRWESYKKERSVQNLLNDLGATYLSSQAFNGRVDLALSSGTNLLLIEFMRPELELDHDHLDRINDYVIEVKERLSAATGSIITKLEAAYLIADSKKETVLMKRKIEQVRNSENIIVMTWDGLIQQAIKQWEEYLELLKERNPTDARIQSL